MTPDIPALKPQVCTKCGQTKPAFEFNKNDRACRICANKRSHQAFIKKHPELKKYPKIRWYD